MYVCVCSCVDELCEASGGRAPSCRARAEAMARVIQTEEAGYGRNV